VGLYSKEKIKEKQINKVITSKRKKASYKKQKEASD